MFAGLIFSAGLNAQTVFSKEIQAGADWQHSFTLQKD
jgi:hypothetical protein